MYISGPELKGAAPEQGNGGTPKAGSTAQATWPFPQFTSSNNFGAAPTFLPHQTAEAPAQQQVHQLETFANLAG